MSENAKVSKYWNDVIDNPDFDGVAPMGGCGRLEIAYRGYFEHKTFKNLIKNIEKPRLLEVGCGSGRWAWALHKQLSKYVGIDISKKSIEWAINKKKKMNIKNCTFQTVPLNKFVSKNKFDIIYFGGVTQYMSDAELEKNLIYTTNLLSNNGVIIDRSTISLEKFGASKSSSNYYAKYRTKKELGKIFQRCGLQLINYKQSYRFLRVGILANALNFPPILRVLLSITPLSYYVFLAITYISDLLNPKVYQEKDIGKFTHIFTVYSPIRSRT